ncbi:MAG: lipopolysaccharide transport periplasmic protein LptA [Thermodesulforhabdaceae bacterium]|jgi:lipopolysaccharide export system protein LptA
MAKKKAVLLVMFLVSLTWGSFALAQREKAFQNDSPIQLNSDRMVFDEKKRVVVFEGHVVVRRDDVTITADRLYIYGKQGEQVVMDKPLGEQLDRIELEGSVRIVQGTKVASSDKAIYYVGPQKVLLVGNPVVAQGQDRISGQMITIYLKEGRSVVEGGQEKPVQVILTPSQTQAGKTSK